MSRPRKLATVPFSPTAIRLIEQIQADARTQLLQDLSAKDSVVVLHGFDAKSKCVHASNGYISIEDNSGNSVNLHRHYQEPLCWKESANMAGYWHPSRWYGGQKLVDINGAKWERDLGVLVCDDYGNLVQVAA